jgi:hypothetical protein
MGLLNWFGSEPKSRAPNSGAHGSSRWARRADLRGMNEGKINAFQKDIGLPVGFFNGDPFYHPAERKPHGLILGSTGTGKTTRISASIALSDAASKMSIVSVTP